jgi:hypothetical protein
VESRLQELRTVIIANSRPHIQFPFAGGRGGACEAFHTQAPGSALWMKTRRMAYWWFRFVVSGRFLRKFLNP